MTVKRVRKMPLSGPIAVNVRDATPRDAVTITTIRADSWQHGYSGIVPDSILDSISRTPSDRLRQQLQHRAHDHTIQICELDDQAIGFVNAGPYRINQRPDRCDRRLGGEIYALYVDPKHWKHGAGSALIDSAIKKLHDSELRPIRLWVLADNHRSREFYGNRGFAFDGAREPYNCADGTSLDELRYRLAHSEQDG